MSDEIYGYGKIDAGRVAAGLVPMRPLEVGRAEITPLDRGLDEAIRMAIQQLDNAPTRAGREGGSGGLTWSQCKALAKELRDALDRHHQHVQTTAPLRGIKTTP